MLNGMSQAKRPIVTRGSMGFGASSSSENPRTANQNSGNHANVTDKLPRALDSTQSQHDTGQGQKH